MTFQNLSAKERWGIAAGAMWGLFLGTLFLSGDASGMWVTVLLGPPAVFLLLPKRPILSWQIPLIAAATCGAILVRDADYPWNWKNFIGVLLLIWSGMSLFSFPWAAIFWAWAQRSDTPASAKFAAILRYMGAGLLCFLACGMLIIGFAFFLNPPGSGDSVDSWSSPIGFLLATLGMGAGLAANRMAKQPALQEAVQLIVGLITSICAIAGVMNFIYYLLPAPATTDPGTPYPGGSDLWFTLAALEAMALVIWLIVTGRRAKKAKQQAA